MVVLGGGGVSYERGTLVGQGACSSHGGEHLASVVFLFIAVKPRVE